MAFNMDRRPSHPGSNGFPDGTSVDVDIWAVDPTRRTPTSAEIDAVIAAAMANAPPHLAPPPEPIEEGFMRTGTPLMTNLLPSAVGMDGRVNLFVGNLPYRVRWQDLKDLFRKAGTVLRADVSLGPDNRSRGYGTVLLGSREDAARAIDRFNGYTWQTRTLEVRPDRLPPEYEAQPHIRPFNNPPFMPRYSPHPPPPGLAPSPVEPVKDPAGLSITPSPLAGALSGPLPDMERRGSTYRASPDPSRGPTPDVKRGSFSSEAAPHFPVPIDGLAHQGMGLGPPSNLHDRVVFVSNMPLTMQWQDLKDFLRPAGMIMRADVAQDDNRKPRGYGTALFATETDAARAVSMFNGREIGGRQIRVYLERQSRPEPPSPPNRLPWGINTAIAQTPQRAFDLSTPGVTPGPNFRAGHPGPISMPPFSPIDNPLSPLQRGLPPMTPSMPGFQFNAFQPDTPYSHHFLSPGAVGPFSPGIPVTPGGFGYSPFINAAPGAPVDRFAFPGGSAALETPTTTAFPPGNSTYGQGNGEYFPMVDSPIRRAPQAAQGMPLNARDRLASTDEELPDLAGRLTLGDVTPGGGSPTLLAERRRAAKAEEPRNDDRRNGEDTRGRYSLDGDRPILGGLNVGNGDGERRASFSDAVM